MLRYRYRSVASFLISKHLHKSELYLDVLKKIILRMRINKPNRLRIASLGAILYLFCGIKPVADIYRYPRSRKILGCSVSFSGYLADLILLKLLYVLLNERIAFNTGHKTQFNNRFYRLILRRIAAFAEIQYLYRLHPAFLDYLEHAAEFSVSFLFNNYGYFVVRDFLNLINIPNTHSTDE